MSKTLLEPTTWVGKLCQCLHCGHEWICRVEHRPLCCAARCERQWYWYLSPDETPTYRKRKTKKKK